MSIDALSIDAPRAARQLRQFLRKVHTHPANRHGVLYVGTPQLNEAIAKYRGTFMPRLAALGPDDPSAMPTLDVMWVWFLHRLAPLAYAEDCMASFGRVLEPSVANPFAFTDDAEAKILEGEVAGRFAGAIMDVSCDIPATAERQGAFLWQVRWAEYDDADFINAAVVRYTKLLELWRDRTDFLVPTYDQDLIWHAHMSHPGAYARDCLRVVGRVVDHDDSVTDRGAGSKLSIGADTSAKLFAEQFDGMPWAKAGCMFRGHPPDWYWIQPALAAAVQATVVPPPFTAADLVEPPPAPPLPAFDGAAPGQAMVAVTVPPGVSAGGQINVVAPDGQTLRATVPEGLTAGMEFHVAYTPMATATVMAQFVDERIVRTDIGPAHYAPPVPREKGSELPTKVYAAEVAQPQVRRSRRRFSSTSPG